MLVALLRIPFQAAQDNLGKIIRHVGIQQLRALGILRDPLVHGLHDGVAAEGQVSGDHLVKNESQGIQVAAVVR